MPEGKKNIITVQEIATNVVLKLQTLRMVPSFAWTGMDLGKEELVGFPTNSFTARVDVYSRTVEFWWDDHVHAYIELRKPYSVEGPWNPAKLILEGVLAALSNPDQRERNRFCFDYSELRVLLSTASGEPVFYHPNNSMAPNEFFWRGRYQDNI